MLKNKKKTRKKPIELIAEFDEATVQKVDTTVKSKGSSEDLIQTVVLKQRNGAKSKDEASQNLRRTTRKQAPMM